jgi:hypothetical protein
LARLKALSKPVPDPGASFSCDCTWLALIPGAQDSQLCMVWGKLLPLDVPFPLKINYYKAYNNF